MRTIKLHYFCQPPYDQRDSLSTRLEYTRAGLNYNSRAIVYGARENKDYLSGSLIGSFWGELQEGAIKSLFGTEGEYRVNSARYQHCAADLRVKHEFYGQFGMYNVEVLRESSLDTFKIIAADHGLSVEVRSILDFYKSYEKELEEKAFNEWKERGRVVENIQK